MSDITEPSDEKKPINNLLTGYMSKTGKEKRNVLKQIWFSEKGKTKTELESEATREIVDEALHDDTKHNPFLEIMLDAMTDIGCAVNPTSNIAVKQCEMEDMMGAYNAEKHQLEICQDTFSSAAFMSTTKAMQATLSNLLVQAFDHCRANFNPTDPKHDMCSSIRAAALSGQCTSESQLHGTVSMVSKKRAYQTCVTNNALLSFLSRHRSWTGEEAYSLLEKVYPTCFFDHSPHDRLPYNEKQAGLSYKAYLTRNRYKV